MGKEIERKFLVTDEAWRALISDEGEAFRQFYLARRDGFSVRLRIVDGAKAFLTMKTGIGLSRGEYEYEIPLTDAAELEAAHIGTVIEKRRFRIPLGDHMIEVDVFSSALAPLVFAEIELEGEEDRFHAPAWFGRELTDDPAYSNLSLALHGLPKES
ncbi:CYTH domain-containing protein [Aureimonas psammosilenae]|uniref:CYTH domain-containing protein n=1 Tax=Aureimonas psammosilenae TaxID=2495496 RepID=UPI001260996A|nr:CYTH domain-containing protein [Aureimonas psammosilenae]